MNSDLKLQLALVHMFNTIQDFTFFCIFWDIILLTHVSFHRRDTFTETYNNF